MRFLQILLVTSSLLWTDVAHATTWWVTSEYQAETLKQYLDALWPEHPMTISVGPQNGRGVWYAQGRLNLNHEGLIRRENTLWDYPHMITTVRGWMATVSVEDKGWTPNWSPPEPSPVVSPTPSASQPDATNPFPASVLVKIGAAGHLKGSLAYSSPSLHASFDFPFLYNNLSIGPHLGMNLFQSTLGGVSSATFPSTTYNRWTLSLAGAWRLPIASNRIEWFARAGIRIFSAGNQRMFSATTSPFVPAWSVGTGLHLWLLDTSIGEFGVGGVIEMDGRTGGLYIAGETLSPYTIKGSATYHWGRNQKK